MKSLKHCVSLSEKLTEIKVKKIGGDQGYSGNDNRFFCKDNKNETSFTQKGRTGKNEVKNVTRREHYGLREIAARITTTEFIFGIHTANVVNLAKRKPVQVTLAA